MSSDFRGSTLVKRNAPLVGKFDQHRFDVVVGNGRLYFAAQGLSFEGPPTRDLEKDINATAWAIDDVKRRDRKVQLAVVALPPKTHSKAYERAERVFTGLRADVVTEERVDDWAHEMAVSMAE